MSTGELQSRCRPAQCTQIVPCQLQTRALWCGDHDLELIRLSSVFPATLDSQPLQMQKRISEMFAPLLAVVQQRDTEAQRLQTASERNEALNKQAADEQKAESKDCSWLLSPYFMLVSGLRPTLAWTIRHHPLAAPRVPRGCPPTKAEREGFERISFFRHSLHPSLCSGPRPFFFSLSPSSLRCLFLFRSLTTSSSSCRLSRPHLCFSLSSIYVSVFALSISLSTHLCLLFRPLSLNVISLILIVSVAVCLSSLSSVCRPLFSLLSVSPLSLSVLCRSFSRFSFVVSDHFLPPSISLLLPLSYFSSTPPPFLIFICSYLLCPSIFSFLLHLLAIFSSRGLSLSLPTSLKYHSSRKRPTCSRGYLRSPCSPTSLLLSMGM